MRLPIVVLTLLGCLVTAGPASAASPMDAINEARAQAGTSALVLDPTIGTAVESGTSLAFLRDTETLADIHAPGANGHEYEYFGDVFSRCSSCYNEWDTKPSADGFSTLGSWENTHGMATAAFLWHAGTPSVRMLTHLGQPAGYVFDARSERYWTAPIKDEWHLVVIARTRAAAPGAVIWPKRPDPIEYRPAIVAAPADVAVTLPSALVPGRDAVKSIPDPASDDLRVMFIGWKPFSGTAGPIAWNTTYAIRVGATLRTLRTAPMTPTLANRTAQIPQTAYRRRINLLAAQGNPVARSMWRAYDGLSRIEVQARINGGADHCGWATNSSRRPYLIQLSSICGLNRFVFWHEVGHQFDRTHNLTPVIARRIKATATYRRLSRQTCGATRGFIGKLVPNEDPRQRCARVPDGELAADQIAYWATGTTRSRSYMRESALPQATMTSIMRMHWRIAPSSRYEMGLAE